MLILLNDYFNKQKKREEHSKSQLRIGYLWWMPKLSLLSVFIDKATGKIFELYLSAAAMLHKSLKQLAFELKQWAKPLVFLRVSQQSVTAKLH